MEGNDALAGAGRAAHPGGAVVIRLNDCALVRMDEDHPFFDVAGEDSLEFLLIGHCDEVGVKVTTVDRACELALCWLGPKLVRLLSHVMQGQSEVVAEHGRMGGFENVVDLRQRREMLELIRGCSGRLQLGRKGRPGSGSRLICVGRAVFRRGLLAPVGQVGDDRVGSVPLLPVSWSSGAKSAAPPLVEMR